MPSGSYVGAVSLSEVGDATVAPGYFVATASRDLAVSEFGDLVVSMDLPKMSPLAAVVNLDGALLGLSYEIPNGRRVISTTEILSLIEKLQDETVCRSVEVVTLDENVRQVLVIEDGVLIEYVHREAFRSKPALFGGDVLLEWAGEKLESVEQFERLYDAQIPGESVEFLVLRNRRRISGDAIVPDTYCEPVESTPIRFDAWGLVLQWVPETRDELRQSVVPSGWLVMVVFEDSPSALAGIEENDLLVTVGGAMVATEQDREIIEKFTERSEPVLLSVRRGARMKLVALVPYDQQTSPDFQ
jgi:S1-C subfamily serine protease